MAINVLLAAVILLASPLSCGALLLQASTRQAMPVVTPRHASPLLMGRVDVRERLLLVDGNNLMGHRKVTKGRAALADKLTGVRSGKVVVVFDGHRGEAASSEGSNPQVVVTCGGDENGVNRQTADEYIEGLMDEAAHARIEVVTADQRLRRVVHTRKGKTINPSKFWRRYLPRLKGLKNDYRNEPKVPDGE